MEMKAGRELDAVVAMEVMDYKFVAHGPGSFDSGHYLRPIQMADGKHTEIKTLIGDLPAFSTDIAAAWEVVEKLGRDGWWQRLERDWVDAEAPWECYLMPSESLNLDNASARADTAPLAICLAALRAARLR